MQQTDARGALVRGLREYLCGLTWDAEGGRELRFRAVREGWAEPEQGAKYPSAAVYTTEPGVYEGSGFTPTLTPECVLPGPAQPPTYIIQTAMLSQVVTLELWCNTPQERMQLCAMMEQALSPVLYRYGFTLQLPFYFGQNATFEPLGVNYDDSEDQAMRHYRLAQFTLRGSVPVCRLVKVPTAKPRFELRNIGTESSVLVEFNVE